MFQLLNLIVVSFRFGKLPNIPESVSTLQSVLLINNTEQDKILIQYLTETGWNMDEIFIYPE